MCEARRLLMSNHLWNHKIHQTLAPKGDIKDREWFHRTLKATPKCKRSVISSPSDLKVTPKAMSSILYAQELWGVLPSLWASSPYEWNSVQYCSNQAHISIVQGSKDVRVVLWGCWATGWLTSLHHTCQSPAIRHNVWGTTQNVPQRTMLGPFKTKQNIRQIKPMFIRHVSP